MGPKQVHVFQPVLRDVRVGQDVMSAGVELDGQAHVPLVGVQGDGNALVLRVTLAHVRSIVAGKRGLLTPKSKQG